MGKKDQKAVSLGLQARRNSHTVAVQYIGESSESRSGKSEEGGERSNCRENDGEETNREGETRIRSPYGTAGDKGSIASCFSF